MVYEPTEVGKIAPHERTVLTADPTQTLRHGGNARPMERPPGGERIEGIELDGILGRGGMGVVYLGRQSIPNRDVAVKTTSEDYDHLEGMLLQEAIITGRLEHPNIVPVHEIRQTEEGQIQVVMKRIQGRTLRSILQTKDNQADTMQRSVEALVQVCNALSFAHDRGIIHRDVKTENIMLGDFGETYLVDWGIAVPLGDQDKAPRGVVGTPSGMAPEMLTGQPADLSRATDVYLLGSTLHEVLTGSPRHNRQSADLLQQIKTSAPATYPPGTPNSLSALANRCCQRNPDDRPRSVLQVQRELQRYLEQRNAQLLLARAKDEQELVRALLEAGSSDPLQRAKLYHHIHRARFGFEQAISLDAELSEARACLQSLVDDLTLMLLKEGNPEAATWFAESSGILSDEARTRLKEAIKTQQVEQAETARLRSLGAAHDPIRSQAARILLAVSIMALLGIVGSHLVDASRHGIKLGPEDLFRQSFYLLIPVVGVLILGGTKLVFDPVGRRAAVGIVGGIVCLILCRWVGYSFEIHAGSIITTEKFVVAMAFANTPPALPSGLLIAILCIATGVIGVLHPSSMMLTSGLLLILILGLVAMDLNRELGKRRGTRAG